MSQPQQLRLKVPKTQKGKRILKLREPQQVEANKKALLLYGEKTSQVVKDVISDLHKLTEDSVRYTRKNADVKPFEAGGESSLQHFANKADCGLFVLATHLKKRPHCLTLGRLYNGQLYDLIELGVERYRGLQDFAARAAAVQAGNKPCFIFAGQPFEMSPKHKLAKNVLLDLFRGQQVDNINLKGLDHIFLVAAAEDALHLRHYAIRLKKSGTKIPRAELTEIGPSLDLKLWRHREASADLHREAHKQLKLTKKKEKNVSTDLLEGKMGKVYVPRQNLDAIALHKMKGLKRERQAAAAAAAGSGAAPAKRAKGQTQ